MKQLINHTAGLGYWFWNADLVRWEYGINTDWLGRVIEAAGGVTLDVAIKEGIIGPLSMDQTAFPMSKDQRDRSVPVHLKGEDGTWAASEIDLNQEPEYWAGGHGLHSTPRDYLTFHRALLAGGTLNGVTILERATVDAAFTNQIGDLDFPQFIASADPAATEAFEAGPDHKWGYGLLLNTYDIPGRRRAGSGARAGLLNTHFWIDRTAGITGGIYTQFLPFVTPEAMAMYQAFETAVYASR